MENMWFYVMLFLLSLGFDRVITCNLWISLVVLISFTSGGRKAFVVAFLAGILDGIMWLKPLGVSSLMFVILCGVIWIIVEQFNWRSFYLMIGLAVLAEFLYRVLYKQPVVIEALILQAILMGVAYVVMKIWGRGEGGVFLK